MIWGMFLLYSHIKTPELSPQARHLVPEFEILRANAERAEVHQFLKGFGDF